MSCPRVYCTVQYVKAGFLDLHPDYPESCPNSIFLYVYLIYSLFILFFFSVLCIVTFPLPFFPPLNMLHLAGKPSRTGRFQAIDLWVQAPAEVCKPWNQFPVVSSDSP